MHGNISLAWISIEHVDFPCGYQTYMKQHEYMAQENIHGYSMTVILRLLIRISKIEFDGTAINRNTKAPPKTQFSHMTSTLLCCQFGWQIRQECYV